MKPAARNPFRHTAIAASAGAGKTFRLAHRYIALLGHGAAPEKICALTFSRKAAGEIFDEIVRYLREAASDPARAEETARHAGVAADARTFAGLLKRFLETLHKLRIGTLDGFLVAVLRGFPLELGAPVDLRLMDEGGGEERSQRLNMLRFILNPRRLDPDRRRAFLEAFKQATFGQDEKQIVERLDRFVRDGLGLYRELPFAEAWNPAGKIWAAGRPYRRMSRTEIESARTALNDIDALGIPGLAETVDTALAATERSRWPAEIARKRAFGIMTGLMNDPDPAPSVSYGRKERTIPPGCADVLRAAASHLFAVELEKSVARTQGLHAVLSQYDALYDARVRGRGVLAFHDLTDFLAAPGAPRLSRRKQAPDRLFIDFRLDSALDHWLLDEFQDTSDSQWSVLRNLIDEIVQDPGGTRSFFYVGDVKQSIYGWRGGNYRLFGNILDRYGPAIELETLAESHRSVPAVLHALNRVFGGLKAIDALPAAALEDWNRYWEEHRSAPRLRDKAGLATLVQVEPGEDENAFDAQVAQIARILNTQRYVERGWTTAVLVRTNEEGRRGVDRLRRACPALDIVHEGAAAILDAPQVTLMLDLLRAAAHPADTLARAHLAMSPLRAAFQPEARWRAFVPATLRRIQDDGFGPLLHDWIARLDRAGGLDAFGRLRCDQLTRAAYEFDQSGERGIDDFIRRVEDLGIRAATDERAVRVMTVHQAKGLGFDAVFLPFGRHGHKLANLRNERFLGGSAAGWVLMRPPGELCETDPVLRAELERQRAEQCFSGLCVLYVAMSRAKRALHMLVDPPPKSGDSVYDATLLRRTLAAGDPPPAGTAAPPASEKGVSCLYCEGRADWSHEKPLAVPPADAVPSSSEPPPPLSPPADPAPRRREPSEHEAPDRPAGDLFNREVGDVLRFGSEIHRLFEQVEWIATADPAAIVRDWKAACGEDPALVNDVERQFRLCLRREEVRRALERPPGDVTLWRERAFDVILDGVLISGRFDRVVLRRAADGSIAGAEIFDYKSNRLADDPARAAAVAERYREQMDDYRNALAALLNISPTVVQCGLLFTRIGRIVRLPPEQAKASGK